MVKSSLRQRQPHQHDSPRTTTSAKKGRWYITLAVSWGGFVVSILFVSRNITGCSFMSISDVATSFDPVVESAKSLLQGENDNNIADGLVANNNVGVISKKPQSFFQSFQAAVDNQDLKERCHRFGMELPEDKVTEPQITPRRIFYGALIADEPWELIDIIAKETYGIFAGMVFVESNRTQNFSIRPWVHAYNTQSEEKLKHMFGTEKVTVRPWINEDHTVRDLTRENLQRQEILRGWKEMGMKPQDIGYLADMDETFSREYLRAIQHCPYILEFDYNHHKCDNCIAKLYGSGKVFEASPNCITKDRHWLLPNAVLGACIEEIGNETLHPRAQRGDLQVRLPGYAHTCGPPGPWNYNMPDNKFPLFAAADFRFLVGGRVVTTNVTGASPTSRTTHSAFHFHNFFANFSKTRFKYHTYGHASIKAMTIPLEDIQEDLRFMIRCLNNETDGTTERHLFNKHPEWQRYNRIVGGIDAASPPLPVYFMDHDYVKRKHQAAANSARMDEQLRLRNLKLTTDQIRLDALLQKKREARRVIESIDAQAKVLEAKINATAKPQ